MADVNERDLQDKLREAACVGDIDSLKWLILHGVDVNAQHEINGWSALHWAAKRNQVEAVKILLLAGADYRSLTKIGEAPATLTTNAELKQLCGNCDNTSKPTTLPITPHYLKYPEFNDKIKMEASPKRTFPSAPVHTSCKNSPTDELVIKIRLANCGDPDFIEVELPKSDLTFSRLIKTCCEELQINSNQITRIRKLPNTILRKDKDVLRLIDLQELEIVLNVSSNGCVPQSPASSVSSLYNGNMYESIYLKKDQTVLY